MNYVTGLVVGKFCPLHKGHEYVIQTALSQCERVIVISYTSEEYPGCSVTAREQWLRGMSVCQSRLDIHVIDHLVYMRDDAPDEVHREFCARYILETIGSTVQAVFTSESYGPGFADYLTDYFTKALITPVKVDHIMVDEQRTRFGISGSVLRDDFSVSDYDNSMFLSPHVRKSFVRKILFLGGESTGKSTISAALAAHFSSPLVEEYGRELYDARNGKLMYEDLTRIATTQLKLESLAAVTLSPGRFIFCDTSPLTTSFYSKEWFGRVSEPLTEMVWDADYNYHKVYLCAPDFPMVQDGTRQDETFREKGHAFYVSHLSGAGVDFTLLTGSLQDKINKVIADLSCCNKISTCHLFK